MENSPISLRMMLYTAIFSLIIVGCTLIAHKLDTRTTLVFCDVGQGDGTYIRIKNQLDVIIDAGPDNSMLKCISQYMPFFDRTIELAFITHPQKDHYYGFLEIGKRYKILNMFMNPLTSDNVSFNELLRILIDNNSIIYFPNEKTHIQVLDTNFLFLWPTVDYLEHNVSTYAKVFKYSHEANQHGVDIHQHMGKSSIDPNLFSLIFIYQEDSVRVLFTGDTSEEVLDQLVEKAEIKTDLLKVPHHGSKKGLTNTFLQLADPSISVISAGRNNRYNHPSQEIIDMFETENKNYINTAEEGSIVYKIGKNIVERVN